MSGRVELVVEGMTCESCVESARAALEAVARGPVEVSLAAGRAWVPDAADLDEAALVAALARAGFDGRLAAAPVVPAPRRGAPERLDVAIVGGGSAAFAAALEAADRGARVTLVNEGSLGGTCVNVGCVPSKTLLEAAHLAHKMDHHPFAGLSRGRPAIDRAALVAQQQELVRSLQKAKYIDLLALHRDAIEVIEGRARFAGPFELDVASPGGGARRISADRILVATGARPAVPAVPGLAATPYWTSTEALVASEIPPRLVVLGAGPVALELGQAFQRLGAQVTLLARSRILSRQDPILGEELGRALADEGMDVRLQALPARIEHQNGLFHVELDGETLHSEALLVATGRRPNTDGMGLEDIGLELDGRGALVVDASLRTNLPHIYGAGDCTNLPQFVYVAAAAGTRAARNMTGGAAALDLSCMPAVVFTDPQVAWVGLDEAAARSAGYEAVTRTIPLDVVPRALVRFETGGAFKIVADGASGRLLGVHLVGPQAGEVVQTAAVALRAGWTVEQLADQLFPYLTMVEGLKLAAQTFTKDVRQLSCCAG